MTPKNIYQSLKKRYSNILMLMFVFAIIAISIFYFRLYKKIMFSEDVGSKKVDEIDKKKLEEVVRKIKEGEDRYKSSLNKKYRDVFK